MISNTGAMLIDETHSTFTKHNPNCTTGSTQVTFTYMKSQKTLADLCESPSGSSLDMNTTQNWYKGDNASQGKEEKKKKKMKGNIIGVIGENQKRKEG